MKLKTYLLATSILNVAGLNGVQAQGLSGQVSSAQEAAMEGVLVSAKKEGSNVTTTVVSNDKGQYSFPNGRLEPGKYTVTIRAIGYVIDGPKSVEIPASGSAKADIKLNKARNLAAQLSNGEWLASAPGSDRDKSFLIGCTSCHSLQRIFTAAYDAAEWEQIFLRMGRYSPGSTPLRPQLLVTGGARSERPRVPAAQPKAAAEYLVSVSLTNPEAREYEFKTLPRPKGVSTKVIYTEYDLPRQEAQPHDVIVDADGKAWYSDFGNQFVGELDPKTGKATEYPIPVLRAEQPKGSLDIEFDSSGNVWLALMYQAGIAKVDRKT